MNGKRYNASIHQPDFLPWMGFFYKISRCENFIVFDNVQLTRGKSWSTRVKVLTQGKENWLTMPIKKSGRSGQKICETEIIDPEKNWKKHLRTIQLSYGKAKYFKEVYEWLQTLTPYTFSNLSTFNTSIIESTCKLMSIKFDNIYLCSQYPELLNSKKVKTELIVEVCEFFDVKEYLSGTGCLSFLDEERFTKSNINIHYHNFSHPTYKQLNTENFHPGLSILDIMFSIGIEQCAKVFENE